MSARRLAPPRAVGSAWSYYRDNIEEEFSGRRVSARAETKVNPLDALFGKGMSPLATNAQRAACQPDRCGWSYSRRFEWNACHAHHRIHHRRNPQRGRSAPRHERHPGPACINWSEVSMESGEAAVDHTAMLDAGDILAAVEGRGFSPAEPRRPQPPARGGISRCGNAGCRS